MGKLNWERARRRPDKIWEKEKAAYRTKDVILNEAISKLIRIKERRIEEGESAKRILRVQKEIDKLIKVRNQVRTASAFIEWRKQNA